MAGAVSHEYLRAIHSPAGCHHAAAGRDRAGRRRGFPPASGLAAAAGGFSDHQVSADLPGASPETMASSVATPLERQFGRIAAVTEMTSSSSLGSTSITLQFDLNRNIDAAARDVQAAINAARGYLPTNLPNNPTYRKVNPADAPILCWRSPPRCSTRGPCTTRPPASWRRNFAGQRGGPGFRGRQRAARRAHHKLALHTRAVFLVDRFSSS